MPFPAYFVWEEAMQQIMAFPMDLGVMLRALRKQKGLTQTALGVGMALGPKTVGGAAPGQGPRKTMRMNGNRKGQMSR